MSDDARTHNAEIIQAILAAERDRTTIDYALSRYAIKQYYTLDEMRHWLKGATGTAISLSLDEYLTLATAPLPASYGALRDVCSAVGARHVRVQMVLDEAQRYG